MGGGVTDQLSSNGYNVIPVNFGGKAGDPDKYPNIISEAWFYMQGIMKDISLVQDNELLPHPIIHSIHLPYTSPKYVEQL